MDAESEEEMDEQLEEHKVWRNSQYLDKVGQKLEEWTNAEEEVDEYYDRR
jgi:hypothetical protein